VSVEREDDGQQDRFALAKDPVVREPEHLDPSGRDEFRPPRIVSLVARVEALRSVELDGQPAGGTEEVQDERPAGMPAPELEAGQAASPQVRPQCGLGVPGATAQGAAAVDGDGHAVLVGRLRGGVALATSPGG
jgi:hypothetical protein